MRRAYRLVRLNHLWTRALASTPLCSSAPSLVLSNIAYTEFYTMPKKRLSQTQSFSMGFSSWEYGVPHECRFSFSGSIFRKTRCSAFFPKFPVSFSCFSHSCIVDLDTLNVLWVSSGVCPACLYSIVRSQYFLNNSCRHFTISFTNFQPWLLYNPILDENISLVKAKTRYHLFLADTSGEYSHFCKPPDANCIWGLTLSSCLLPFLNPAFHLLQFLPQRLPTRISLPQFTDQRLYGLSPSKVNQ